VFLLRAKDAFAPMTLRFWADSVMAAAKSTGDPEVIAKAEEIAALTRVQAAEMEHYAKGIQKMPDLPETGFQEDPEVTHPIDTKVLSLRALKDLMDKSFGDFLPEGIIKTRWDSQGLEIVIGPREVVVKPNGEHGDSGTSFLPEDQIIKAPKVITVYVADNVPIAELENLRKHLDAAKDDPDYTVVTNYPVAFSEAFAGTGEVKFDFISKDMRSWSEAEIRAVLQGPGSPCGGTDEDAIIEALKGGAS